MGLSALAILAVIGGVLGILEGLSLLKAAQDYDASGSGIAFYGLCVLAASVGDLAVAWGLWQLRPWGWTSGVSVVTAQIGLAMWAMLGGLIGAGLVSLIVNGIVLWYLDTPSVRLLFGRGPSAITRGSYPVQRDPYATPPPMMATPLAPPPGPAPSNPAWVAAPTAAPTTSAPPTPASDATQPDPSPPSPAQEVAAGYCVACGTAMAADFAFCPKCGTRAQQA